jgi:hypothetical protein
MIVGECSVDKSVVMDVCVCARAHVLGRGDMYICVSLQFVKIYFRFFSHVRNWKVFH